MVTSKGVQESIMLVLGACLLIFVSACSHSPSLAQVTPQPTQSEVYNYDIVVAPANATKVSDGNYYLLQPGNQIRIVRQPVAYGVGERAVSIFAEKLIGPFSSLEAAQQIPSDQFESASPVVAASTPYQIENWVKVTHTSTLQLPLRQVGGYYWILEKICHQGEDTNFCSVGGSILRIPG